LLKTPRLWGRLVQPHRSQSCHRVERFLCSAASAHKRAAGLAMPPLLLRACAVAKATGESAGRVQETAADVRAAQALEPPGAPRGPGLCGEQGLRGRR